MGHSRQAYYQGRRRQTDRIANAQTVVELVREQRMRQPRIGTRKLHHLLQEPLQRQAIAPGRDAMFDVLLRTSTSPPMTGRRMLGRYLKPRA